MLISYLHVACVFVFSLAIVLITILFICPYSPHKARKLGGKKSQRKEPPAKNVDMEPGQEKEGGPSVVQGKEGMEGQFVFHL